MSKIVVTGAAGAQGGAIAQAFASAGHEVVGLTRAPSARRPDLVAVDMEDTDALARALAGADLLAFTSPIDHRPGVREALAERLVAAAERAGVGRILLNTAGGVPDALRRPVADVLRQVRATVMGGGVPSIVVEPTVYLENLLQPWAAEGIAAGVLPYPAPRAARISWLSHGALGAFAVAAAERAVPGGRILPIGGPEALSGDEMAARLGAALGRPMRYEEIPLDAFAAAIDAAMGAPAGADIADSYRHLSEHPDALARDGAAARELGVAPEPAAAWAARQAWGVAVA